MKYVDEKYLGGWSQPRIERVGVFKSLVDLPKTQRLRCKWVVCGMASTRKVEYLQILGSLSNNPSVQFS